jgi:predicted nucleic acid-binding protein
VPEVVVDASVAVKWVLEDEEHRAEALRRRQDIRSGTHTLVVPSFWDYELASIFSKAVSTKRLTEERGRQHLSVFLRFPAVTIGIRAPDVAFADARRFQRSVIDSFYLSLAEERGCDFWSDDRKLCRALSTRFPFVRWIGDYAAPASPAP